MRNTRVQFGGTVSLACIGAGTSSLCRSIETTASLAVLCDCRLDDKGLRSVSSPNLRHQLQSTCCGVGVVRKALSLPVSAFSNKG